MEICWEVKLVTATGWSGRPLPRHRAISRALEGTERAVLEESAPSAVPGLTNPVSEGQSTRTGCVSWLEKARREIQWRLPTYLPRGPSTGIEWTLGAEKSPKQCITASMFYIYIYFIVLFHSEN